MEVPRLNAALDDELSKRPLELDGAGYFIIYVDRCVGGSWAGDTNTKPGMPHSSAFLLRARLAVLQGAARDRSRILYEHH